MKKRIILAVTGASGSLYTMEFLKIMQQMNVEIHGILSDAGRQVMQLESGLGPDDLKEYVTEWHDVHNFAAPMSSGSALFDAMVVLPCTMGTLAAIANGISGNLIHRAADVSLKEQRKLLLAVRETPLNKTHLKNMLKAHEAGATICPLMPSFYHKPKNLEEMARAFSSRLCDLLGFPVVDTPRWPDK